MEGVKYLFKSDSKDISSDLMKTILPSLQKKGIIKDAKKILLDWDEEGGSIEVELDPSYLISPDKLEKEGFILVQKGKKSHSQLGEVPAGKLSEPGKDEDDEPSFYLRVTEVYPYAGQVFQTVDSYKFKDGVRQLIGGVNEIKELAQRLGYRGMIVLHDDKRNIKFKKLFSDLDDKDVETGVTGDPVAKGIEAGEPKPNYFASYDSVQDLQDYIDTISSKYDLPQLEVISISIGGKVEVKLEDTVINIEEDEDGTFIATYEGSLLDEDGNFDNLIKRILTSKQTFASRIQRIARYKRRVKRPTERKMNRKLRIKAKKEAIKNEKDPLKKRQLKAELEIEQIKLRKMHADDQDPTEFGAASGDLITEVARALSNKTIEVDDSPAKCNVVRFKGESGNVSDEDKELLKGLLKPENGYIAQFSNFSDLGSYEICFVTPKTEFESEEIEVNHGESIMSYADALDYEVKKPTPSVMEYTEN